ncbi:SusC/RagA family TonB-linked outer membrane protein [Parabacteroides johnsonii]|uniref:SusC/RagA family TonB-linked outer membrane protein n=1 Tax=Parabacteroides johnsonii TaxID=387661 RepID=UPI001E52D610|nr:SusC/RagA family TonB-linked outer membrane protein [Parabacteroides johnsonii]
MKKIGVLLILYLISGMSILNAQQNEINKYVKGKVTDSNGEPLIGVNVIEKGTSNGSISDLNGHYSLQISSNKVTLSFSYIGYLTQEITVEKEDIINMQLQEDALDLDEIVVIGYGTAKKRDLTGAISSVRAEKLEMESPRSVQDLLRSNVAGLDVSMPIDAAGTSSFQIRGKNTLSANSSPLMVVDGVIYDGNFQDINPNDIQSVDILKDASSAAVYGAKAANGVIVITTKKGRKGKPLITFNTNIGFVQPTEIPRTLDGSEFIRFRQDYEIGKTTNEDLQKYPEKFTDPRLLGHTGIDPLAWYNYTQNTPVAALPSDEKMISTWLTRLELSDPEIQNYLINKETNWDDLVYRSGFQQDYTASISNKTDNMSYYWSLGYADREGVKSGDRFKNLRTRLNLESNITNFLTVGLTSSFATRDNGALVVDDAARQKISPYGSNNIGNEDMDIQYWQYPTGNTVSKNPFFDNMYRDKKNMIHTLNANIYTKLALPFGIEYQLNFTPYYNWEEDFLHESSQNPEWEAKGGSASRITRKTFNWQLDNIIRWKKTFNHIHDIEVTLLANAEKGQYWATEAKTSNFSPNDILGYHAMQSGTVPLVSSNDTYKTGDALMVRVFYSLKDRYMITASVRRDGYSAFGSMNPRAVFPAVALGWVFSSEKFAENTTHWLNYGKLRFSWGENGNRDVGQYEALAEMKSGTHPYFLNGNSFITSYLYVNRMANKALQWERTASYNIGLDFSLFNDILSGSLETYISETNDLLVSRSLPQITGFSNVMSNLGKLGNKGFELTLNANIVNHRNFSWNASGTFSFNRRNIKKLYGEMVDVLDENGQVIGQKEADDSQNGWFIGHDPDQIWDYERDGVWQIGEEEDAAKYGLQPGDFRYIDRDKDGVMTDKDKVFQGHKTPRFRWSLKNEFTFHRNFSLSFMLYSLIGQYGSFNRAANSISSAERTSWYAMPYWTTNNLEEDYGRIGSKNIGTNYVNKSFVRLENVTFSYNVPQTFLQKIKIQNMRISLSVRNIAVFSPGFDFGDPEGSGENITPRTFNLGINFSL